MNTTENFIKLYCEQHLGSLDIPRNGHTWKDTEARHIYFYFMSIFTNKTYYYIAKTIPSMVYRNKKGQVKSNANVVRYAFNKVKGLLEVDKKFYKKLMLHYENILTSI